jgi:hypothetical protein
MYHVPCQSASVHFVLVGLVCFSMKTAIISRNSIVTCMRFPWFNNVSTATTMG